MEKFNQEFNNLNKEQKEAVIYDKKALFVNSGAGTGKTKTLTMKIAYLIKVKKIKPDRILVLTFSNKAAKEMLERTIKLIGKSNKLPSMSTFHSFCYSFLRKNIKYISDRASNFTIIDASDVKDLLIGIISNITINEVITLDNIAKQIMSYKLANFEYEIDKEKNDLPKTTLDILKIYNLYQSECKKNNLIDFNDLLILTRKILIEKENIRMEYQNSYDYVLVDEFQDTDLIQYEILKLLNNVKTFTVGDPKQSIYGFRGARYENVLSFIKDFGAKEMLLSQNYRSTNSILNVANKLLAQENKKFTNNKLYSNLGEGEIPILNSYYNEQVEAINIAYRISNLIRYGYKKHEIAVLYRSNYLKTNIEQELIKSNIPYVIFGNIPFYKTKEVKVLLSYFSFILDLNNDFYFKKVINFPKRGIGKQKLGFIEQYAIENNISMFEAITNISNSKIDNGVLLNFKKMIIKLKKELEVSKISDYVDNLCEILNYENIIINLNLEAQEKIIKNINQLKNVFRSKKIDKTKSNLENLREIINEFSLDSENDKNEYKDAVVLSTIHQVKGLEFKAVFIVGLAENIFPTKNVGDNEKLISEEERIFYVAVTRAKEKLYLSYPLINSKYKSNLEYEASRFLKKIYDVLIIKERNKK